METVTATRDRAAPLTPDTFAERARDIEREVGKVIVGQQELVRLTLVGLLANSHVLLEGVPGLGKTMLVRTIGDVIDCSFNRIQFTPDLMPADITGTNILVEEATGRVFRFQPGPIFANLVLADEINRATPKTQSSLLEAMQEHQVTVARNRYPLEPPFFVLATQNPLEMEGTYPLPEAQLDRFFFKLHMGYPSREDLMQILSRTTAAPTDGARRVLDGDALLALQRTVREVPIARHVQDYAVRMLQATHPTEKDSLDVVKRFVKFGASPR
ncbi:MAG: AAA family ATPase, partial [Chloroflexota bacterium]